jgi:hypothetical protein
MGYDVCYTWNCDKCGAIEKNNGGRPNDWRYADLTLYHRNDSKAVNFTNRFIVCNLCHGTFGSMNDTDKRRKTFLAWMFKKAEKPTTAKESGGE